MSNDDGVFAPGLAALARALDRWSEGGRNHEVVVVAPLANHSGAGAAVGTVYERSAIAYERVRIDGAEDLPAYGVDGSPALCALLGALGGFGEPPDLIISGINLGVNVGRSILHSGTVGAALTGAQMGVSGLAVSLRSGHPPEPWESAATLAVSVIDILAGAPKGTVLNLNVPALALSEIRGVRRARISRLGIVRAAHGDTVDGGPRRGGPPHAGTVRLSLGAAVPSLGTLEGVEDDDDAALIAHGFATITPLEGVKEIDGEAASTLCDAAIERATTTLSSR